MGDQPGHNRFWRHAAILSGGMAFAHLLGLVSLPLVSRLFTQGEIGAVALLLSLLSLPGAFASLRYDSAIMICGTDDEAVRIGGLSALLSILVAGLSTLALLAMGSWGYAPIAEQPFWYTLAAFPLVLIAGWAGVHRLLHLRTGRFNDIATGSAWRAGASASLRLGAGWGGLGMGGLLLAEIGSLCVSLWRLSTRSPLGVRTITALHPGEIRRLIRLYARFPVLETPSQILDQAALMAPMIWVGWRFGADGAGLFAFALRIATAPNAIVGMATADIFRSKYAQLVREDRFAEAGSLFIKIARQSFLLACLFGIAALLIAPFFGGVFGENWVESGRILPWLALWWYSSFVVSPLSSVLTVHNRLRAKLAYDILSVSMTTGALIWCTFVPTDLVRSIAITACAQGLANLGYGILLFLVVRHHSSASRA